jgi:hypothetical protein
MITIVAIPPHGTVWIMLSVLSLAGCSREPAHNVGRIRRLHRDASKNGTVKDRLTHAEDLTEKVTDTEREVALLTTHRDRLSEFLKDKSLKVDQVITVSRELASAVSALLRQPVVIAVQPTRQRQLSIGRRGSVGLPLGYGSSYT